MESRDIEVLNLMRDEALKNYEKVCNEPRLNYDLEIMKYKQRQQVIASILAKVHVEQLEFKQIKVIGTDVESCN